MAKRKTSKSTRRSLFSRFPRSSKFRFWAVIVIFVAIGSLFAFRSYAAVSDGSVPVYRVQNAASQKYLLTTNLAEATNAWSKLGFTDQGTRFYAWTGAGDGRIPVFRLNKDGGWLFTSSTTEKTNLVTNNGYHDEGIAFYAYANAGGGHLPVYRLFNSLLGSHLFTTDATERDNAKKFAYADEGIAYYVSANAPPTNTAEPSGHVTANTCNTIAGSVRDADNPGAPNEAHIYIDGVGNVVKPTTTKSGSGEYNFTFAVPANWRDGKQHRATVYAINVDSTGRVTGNNVVINDSYWICSTTGADLKPQLNDFYQAILHDCSKIENFTSDRCVAQRAKTVQLQDFAKAVDQFQAGQRLQAFAAAVEASQQASAAAYAASYGTPTTGSSDNGNGPDTADFAAAYEAWLLAQQFAKSGGFGTGNTGYSGPTYDPCAFPASTSNVIAPCKANY